MRCPAATIPDIRTRCRRRRRAARTAAACAALLLAGTGATAGPWAREAGEGFLSFGISGEETRTALMLGVLEPERTLSAYGELGLGYRLTAGVDITGGEVSRMVVVFLRRTLTAPDSAWQVALDTGLGTRAVEGQERRNLARIGASLGLGFGPWEARPGGTFGHRGGWIAVDAMMLADTSGQDPIWQSEVTLGLNLTERARGILAMKAEEWPGAEMVVTARPSVVFALREGTSVQAGMHAGVSGSDTVGLSLSLWQEF
ncbi:hypothetical protein P6F26_05885 [Roseibacterium sp. SDUM158017]|uniref:hypothetical protein n=1 Tax=Roseicyclus salinarum TaxID=3036773 RepID=UPI0024154829|nr:hypothetical protein [Roseibacterium sp. SDUM158017]MDG4647967.1 hypothetical protein [Roseibacterium sp. SDUM158017]